MLARKGAIGIQQASLSKPPSSEERRELNRNLVVLGFVFFYLKHAVNSSASGSMCHNEKVNSSVPVSSAGGDGHRLWAGRHT